MEHGPGQGSGSCGGGLNPQNLRCSVDVSPQWVLGYAVVPDFTLPRNTTGKRDLRATPVKPEYYCTSPSSFPSAHHLLVEDMHFLGAKIVLYT